jgi:hypothetical protein
LLYLAVIAYALNHDLHVISDIMSICLQTKGTHAELELTNPIGEVTCGDETVLMHKIDKRCRSFAKSRRTHLRKEQISLGVLKRLLQSMGRFSYEEVCSQYMFHWVLL